VDYELLPHLNRFEAPFLETVRRYSERVPHDIIALADGAAVLHMSSGGYRSVGPAARFRNGVMSPIASTLQADEAGRGEAGSSRPIESA
jgi:hypothetical protein